MKSSLCLLFSFFLTLHISGQKTVDLKDYGVSPWSFRNSAGAIRAVINSIKYQPGSVIRLPGGRMDVWPEGSFKKELYISNTTENDTLSKVKNIAFLLEDIKGLTIDGNNTLIVLHGKMESFAMLRCSNITVKDLQFDYEVPTMSEMEIISVSPAEVRVRMHPDTRYLVEEGKIILHGEGWRAVMLHAISFEPETGIMRYSSFNPFLSAHAEAAGCREVIFRGDFGKSDLKPGMILTVRDHYRDNSGGFIANCRDIVIENVAMHYMHGLGIVSQFSENLSFKNITVAPQKGSGRVISAWADCFHFSGCRGTILIDSCRTSGSHDDPINIHGTHLKITKASGNMATVRFMHNQTYGIEAFFRGDSIVITDPATLKPMSGGVITSAKLVSNREMELEIKASDPLMIREGYVIENLTWTPEAIIRNSVFEKVNTRGLLITTPGKVLIENNVFRRTGMHAILIANDASSWYESGAVKNVTIRNNTFEECGYNQAPGNYIIAISPENHELVPGFMVHRNILIENNTFRIYDYPVLTARSTGNLIFRNNTIIRTSLLSPGVPRPQFSLSACTDVVITRNDWKGFDDPKIKTSGMKMKDIKTDLKIIR